MSVPKRSEVPVEYTWDLSHIFPSDEDWETERLAIQEKIPEITAFKGKLSDAKMLLAWFRLNDELAVRLSKLHGYASMHSDEDTANSTYQAMNGKATSLYVAIGSAASFSTPEIMAISEEDLEQFYREVPELEGYRRSLFLLRRLKDHILSPAEEKLLAAARDMAGAPDDICSILRDAELRFPEVSDPEGNVHPLTNGSLVPLLEHPDPAFRLKVFNTYYDRLGEYKATIASTLNAQFKSLKFFASARKYPDTREAALNSHEVPVSVYDSLITAVHNNLEPMHRYVALRKKLLGVETLHMSDVYAPIIADAAVKVPYEEAVQTVTEALSVLGDDYIAVVKEAFENRWIDIYENEGKRGGAYSSGTGWPHPYMLLNYKDNLDSMFTLAHEMGHSMHTWYSVKNQPVATADYVIFVAEVASTCNEVLLMKYLLGRTTDKKERAYLINHFLDSFKGTLYRQTMFAEFEWEMGRLCEAGEVLTADVLCEKYKALNALYYGPEMVSDDRIALEWARIPHFFYNYYVFQYATSFAAAMAIAPKILEEGAPAVERYKQFLSGGCSQDPISLLKIAGVDMSTPQPVEEALKFFSSLVDEMEELTKEA